MTSNPSISLSPAPTHSATLSPPGRSTRPNSQVISPIALSTARLAGNRSPNSIPSSPTSVHSSSSAIFERDIEQLASPHPGLLRDPHHTARAMTHELDAAVPSVLSSAINALNLGSEDDISVIAPAHMNVSRFGNSRSPSPTTRPQLIDRQSTGPHLPGAFPGLSTSPTSTSASPEPVLSPGAIGQPISPSSPLSPTTPPLPTARPRPRKSNPQLSTDTSQNRLSFMSYHDLLASTPLASVPLSAITSGQDAPGHLPGVVGLHGHGSVNGSIAGGLGANEGEGGDVGHGEFDREGLGRGLEERLEAVLAQERVN
ncbi:hypothetical protein FRC12_011105 [Ceratobasidium sp. 428]|nr:hypothetical protein FRC12_011743 [Ceratobasidium sp. 428]KAG8754726.1 hypothetical protein FRC12_011105 [Ceratobasidium sp. 428]